MRGKGSEVGLSGSKVEAGILQEPAASPKETAGHSATQDVAGPRAAAPYIRPEHRDRNGAGLQPLVICHWSLVKIPLLGAHTGGSCHWSTLDTDG